MENTFLISYTETELKTMIYAAVKAALDERENPDQTAPQPFIKGIHELARFLRVSPGRAQKLKNEGIIPYWQDGRTLLFDPEKVKKAMIRKEVRHGK